MNYILIYRRSSCLKVIGYLDVNFMRCLSTRKSTFGYVFLLAGGAVSWKSIEKILITPSTFDAEYVACFEAMGYALWLCNSISRLEIMNFIGEPLLIF